MKKAKLLALVLVLVTLIFTACGNRDAPASVEESITYDEIINRYSSEELAVILPSDRTEINIHLVEQWVSDYQQGVSATLPVYWFGMAGPSIMLVESRGDKEYTMDAYDPTGAIHHYISSYVIERKYDYVFGADFPSDLGQIAISFPKERRRDTAYEWDGITSLGSLTLEEAVAKAKEISADISTFARKYGIRASGIYLSENAMSAAPPFEENRDYIIHEAREKDGELFYIIGSFDDQMNPMGELIALSVDGTNAFLISMMDDSWIYCYDENERVITPTLSADSVAA